MIKKIRSYLDDPDLDVQYKSFILLSIIALIGLFLGLVGGIVINQSILANLSLVVEFSLFAGIFFYSVWLNKLRFAMVFISTFLVFVFLPISFFTSGGAAGGTPVWFMFATLYILMVLSGKTKAFYLAAESLIIVVCWVVGFYHPELIIEFTRPEAFIDSMLTLFIVGTVMAILINYQTVLFRRENERVRRQKTQIESLNRSQNLFFSAMSHEIRTPINSILGLNEVILRQEDASDEIIKDAASIQSAGRLLLSLINDLLDISKIEAGKMDIVPVDYEIADIISDIAGMVSPRVNEKGLAFNVSAAHDIPSVLFGDEVRIRQIVINLLNNSVKYTHEGSVNLKVRSENTGIDSINLIISVSDTGIGIRKEALPDLFDAYRRVDQEKNRNIEGTGLGLSIVKQLIDLMGGEITVDSIYGSGSTFTVCLPQKISDPRPLGDFSVNTSLSLKERDGHLFTAAGANVLIVDDNEMNLAVETRLLAGTGLVTDTAMSGADALKMTKKKHYDVILMDHLMPVMSGIECLSAIRSQEDGLNTDVPVVVLTANADGENRELYKKSGFDGYLVKPVTGKQLEEMLMKHIPAKKLGRPGTAVIPEDAGSGESFKTILRLFCRSIPQKSSELEEFYASKDWENYTIKIHALKSSAKIVGAHELSEMAQKLEDAGKKGDADYIREHHEEMIRTYRELASMAAPPSGVQKKRVMVIDDDELYSGIIRQWIKDMCSVEIFTDGMKGVEWLAENRADLILLDYMMPKVNGPEILEILRSNPDTASIPVYFLTGVETKESLAPIMSLKPQGCILKSTSRGDLRKIIEDALA
ncbi:MAG: response regulator [Lachnospiraceae bacterium]|nr:response regulator [Lachnospiraceae bacterium]